MLEEEEAGWLAGLLANLPMTGSLNSLLIERVAKGNLEGEIVKEPGIGEETLGLPHWGSQMKQGLSLHM
jgi:hypothetical protein